MPQSRFGHVFRKGFSLNHGGRTAPNHRVATAISRANGGNQLAAAPRRTNVLYLVGDARETKFVSGAFDTYPHLSLDFSVPIEQVLQRLGEPGHYDVLMLGWSLPEAEALSVIGQVREQGYPLAILAAGEQSPERFRQAGVDEFVQKGASFLARLPVAIEEALEKKAQPSAAASSPQVRRIAYSGEVEFVKNALKGEGSHIQVMPLADALQGSACDVVVIDHSSAPANTATTMADVRSRNLDAPIVLIINPPEENSVLRAYASDLDDVIVRTPGWATRLPLRLGLAFSRHQQLRELATLRVKEARLRTLVDSLPAAIIRLSPEGAVLAVNTVATSLLGGTETRQLLRKPFYSLVNAADRDACAEFVTRVCGGEQRSLEVSITTLTGEGRTLEVKAIPMAATEAGGSASMLAILRDIADGKVPEAPVEQARSTPRMEASLANVAEEFATEAPQATGNDPHSLRELEAELHRLSGRARVAFEELEASLRDAEARHEAAAAHRLEEAARQLEEQARQQAAERERWQSYDSFVQSATHGIFHTPLTDDLLDVNTAFSMLLGYPSPDDLLAEGRSIDRFTSVDEWRLATEGWRQGTEPVETRWRKKDGSLLTLRLQGRMIGAPHGDERLEVIAENVTAQRVLETELRRARRWEDIARVTTGIAADLKHVIESLSQSTDRFVADLPQDAAGETGVVAIQKGASKALSLSRQLVAYGRKGARVPEAIDLNGTVRALEAMMRRMADEHIELTFDLASTLRPIQADQPTLEEALINLTLAASDVLPAGGRINIATTSVDVERSGAEDPPDLKPGSYGLLSLAARGWGIEDAPEPESSTPLMSLSRAIAQIGGCLKVESVAGESLTFWVYLPHVQIEETTEG